MNDTVLRHLVSALATVIVLMAYYSGYVSGQYGWWWTGFAMLVIYGIVYKVVDAGKK